MDKTTVSQELLDRYLANRCTAEEKTIVEGWFNRQLKINTYTTDQGHLQKTEDQIWNAIQAYQVKTTVPVFRKIKLWQVISAAAASVAVILLFNIFLNPKKTLPATLAMSTIVTTSKENNLIQLPDGSLVILDKGSKLDFSKSFKGKKIREVYLSGKAFFDIKHNPSQPFIVHSGKVKTTVLGTAFDISASPGSDEIMVRVIRGKVNVSTEKGTIGDLLPNEKVTYHLKTDLSNFSNVNAQKEMQWTSQDMLLNDISFEAICAQLEKRYAVKITIEDSILKSKKFTISLTANEKLNSFLATVCDFNGAKYQYDKEKNTYTINSIN